MAVLSTGASGAAVADLQNRLAALGFNPGPIDGRYGPRTAAAVKLFQASAGIPADSVAGDQTQAALGAVGAPQAQAVQGPAANPLDPAGDSQFLNYQRALGVSESDLTGATAIAVGRAQRDLALRMPDMAEALRGRNQGISDSYEARGLGSDSGRRNLDLQRSNIQGAEDVSRAKLSTADTVADANSDLAMKLAQGRRDTAEQATAASQRRATTRAQLGL